MKLMLVGYLENLNSDRRIIACSRMRMDILYFLGYNPDEELPWHSTLSRTRQLYGEQEFISLFKVVLKQCIDKGMVSGKRQAIDSVFVKANAAISSMVEREILEDASVYSKELEFNKDDQDRSAGDDTPNDGGISTAPASDKTAKRTMQTAKGKKMRQLRSSTVEPVLGTLVNFTAMRQVCTKGIGLANKCMIMAAVAYNLKKLINGVRARVRKRIRKPFGNGSNDLKDTLLTWIIKIGTVISTFKLSSKSKWLNNHLLRKLNYSAI